MKKMLPLILVVLFVVIIGGAYLVLKNRGNTPNVTEKKSPHFESSTPASNATLAAVPPNVVIDFNFDLMTSSSIDILRDGTSYASREPTVDENKLAMRRNMSQDAPDGAYTVKYNACWPDGSCHDGQFGFTVDRTRQTSFMDFTDQKEVTIHMSQIKFSPMEIKISKDTNVTWVNDDEAAHYVNTDAHPAHTHIIGLNSKALSKGESYSYTFDKTGAYPYHCSAHADSMTGTVVVVE